MKVGAWIVKDLGEGGQSVEIELGKTLVRWTMDSLNRIQIP